MRLPQKQSRSQNPANESEKEGAARKRYQKPHRESSASYFWSESPTGPCQQGILVPPQGTLFSTAPKRSRACIFANIFANELDSTTQDRTAPSDTKSDTVMDSLARNRIWDNRVVHLASNLHTEGRRFKSSIALHRTQAFCKHFLIQPLLLLRSYQSILLPPLGDLAGRVSRYLT